MQHDALAAWTPVSLTVDAAGTTVDWGDLRGIRFDEPFFDQTIARWAGTASARIARTDGAALEALDAAPSLDPDAIIFHLSRCGSTLVSRLLATVPGVLVIAEPAPLNALLAAEPQAIDEATRSDMLRLLVRALGRRRFGDERRYILKLSSWNVRRLHWFRLAFPRAKLVWVQRQPDAVMKSLLANPPAWAALRHHEPLASSLFGSVATDLGSSATAAFCAQALSAMLEAAQQAGDDLLLVDYRELPEATWERVAPFVGLSLDGAAVARMREEAAFYSKDPGRRPFTAERSEDRAGDPTEQCTMAHERYRALDARRLCQLAKI